MAERQFQQEESEKFEQQKRLQHQLELQSQQIERVLSHHQFPAQIAGGTVERQSIRFDLSTHLSEGWDRLRDLTYEIKSALKVPDVRLSREGRQLRLHIIRPESPPVTLLDLLPLLPDLPPLTATLGLAEDGRPILLDFANPDVTHVLLTGDEMAGKTMLLRTLALSLAIKNRQSQLQLLVIDPETVESRTTYTQLEPLAYLPHMLTGISYRLEEVVDLLNFLHGEMSYRRQQEVDTPTIIVLVDKAAHLMEVGGEPVLEPLSALLQHGADAGIHFVLSTEQPETAVLNNTLRANLPVRLVGQVGDEEAARTATGLFDSQAEYLLGQGDFMAIVGGEATHFQGAYIGDYDLHLCLDEMQRHRPLPLLAQSVSIRPLLTVDEGESSSNDNAARPFQFDGQTVSLNNDEAERTEN